MFRLSLILIVVFGSSSIGFAQYCPNGRCCRIRPPVDMRFRSVPYRQPNELFERPADRFPAAGQSESDIAPPAPGIDESGLQQLPPGSNIVPPGEDINESELQPQVPTGTEVASPAEANDPLAGIDLHGQRLCPVTGEKLGSMGPPLPVTVKGQTIYVCCKACVSAVKRNPDKYLPKVAADRNAQTKTAPAKRPGSTAQQTCPVTGKKLGSMGPPIPVTVLGRTVYVCCEGCVETLKRNPAKYLKMIDAELKLNKKPTSTGNKPAPMPADGVVVR